MWLPVVGYEGRYEVSSNGKVRTLKWKRSEKAKLLTKKLNDKGYYIVSLYDGEGVRTRNQQRVHRIVASTFIPNPKKKLYINHKNGIKTDNRIENLEWVTMKENAVHSMENGFTPSGEKVWFSKLSEKQVVEIKTIVDGKTPPPYQIIAAKYGVNKHTIKRIKAQTVWKHLWQKTKKCEHCGSTYLIPTQAHL